MTIKLISLNLWIGGTLMPGILDFLRQQAADILLLQEVCDSQDASLPDNYRSMTVLREELGYQYDEFALSYLDDNAKGMIPNGNAVFSKFPLREATAMALDGEIGKAYKHTPENFSIFPRILQVATAETPVGEITLGNMHGIWDLNGDDPSPRRQQMVDRLITATQDRQRVVLAGDSNAKVTNPAMRRLETDLINVFQPDLTTTFNMRRKDDPGYAAAAVDVMYVSPDVSVVSAECPDVDISDHLPLISVLNIT